jgi:phosphoheptose isomerase
MSGDQVGGVYFSELSERVLLIPLDIQEKFVNAIFNAIKRGNSIYVAGNGGSAAISMHFVTDLIKIGIDLKCRISAYDLTSNNSLVTCVSNDYGFNKVFEYQLRNFARKGDLFIALSSSGNSENILNALEACQEFGLEAWAIIGFEKSKAVDFRVQAIELKLQVGQYGIAEDVTAALCHKVAYELRARFS